MIPKTFDMAGRKWTVQFLDQEAAEKHYGGHHDDLDGGGLCSVRSAVQYIIDRDGYESGFYEVTHFHEVIHAIFYAMGYEVGEGPHTELIVDGMAHYLHQYMKSKKGKVEV